MTKFYRRVYDVVSAVQLTPDNLANLEGWTYGSIKGTSLPIERRAIDFYSDDGEQRAEMGDWIVLEGGVFQVYRDDQFRYRFTEA